MHLRRLSSFRLEVARRAVVVLRSLCVPPRAAPLWLFARRGRQYLATLP